MFAHSDSFRWLDPHLVLPGGPIWEDDVDESTPSTDAAQALASVDTTGRFPQALAHMERLAQTDILSTCAENSWGTDDVFQRLRSHTHGVNTLTPASRGAGTEPVARGPMGRRGEDVTDGRDVYVTGASESGSRAETEDSDEEGALLGAFRGNGLLSMLTDDRDDLGGRASQGRASTRMDGWSSPTAAASSHTFGALLGSEAAQRQARKAARQAADMTARFHPLPRHTGVREETVLCPLDPNAFAMSHVASGNGVFAVVTAEMPQRVYLFDQMNDVLITCRMLGGETFPPPRVSHTETMTTTTAARASSSADMLCTVGTCTIEPDDRVKALFMNPTGHVCVVTMVSGKAVYVYIPHRPSSTDQHGAGTAVHREDDDEDNASDEDDDKPHKSRFSAGSSISQSAGASLADRGTKAWRRSARRWLHLGHRKNSGAKASGDADTRSEASHDGEDEEEERRYRPVAFSLTVSVRRADAAATAIRASHEAAMTSNPLSDASSGSTPSTNCTSEVASAIAIESIGWGCAEDAAVTRACVEHTSSRSGAAGLVSALIGSRHGGIVLACQFASRRGLAGLAVVGQLPLRAHLASTATDEDFPIEGVDIFFERVPVANDEEGTQANKKGARAGDDGDAAMAGASISSSARRAAPGRSSMSSLSRFPEYTHKPHFLSTDQYEHASGFQVEPANVGERDADGEAAPSSLNTNSQNKTQANARVSSSSSEVAPPFAVRGTVLLAVKNRLYVLKSDSYTIPTVFSSSSPRSKRRSGRENDTIASTSSCFIDAARAAFSEVQCHGSTWLDAAYVSLPCTPSAATADSGSEDRALFDRHTSARSSLQLLSPQCLLEAASTQAPLTLSADSSRGGKASGHVTAPASIAAAVPATFYWFYKGWLVHGLVLSARVNAWERLTRDTTTTDTTASSVEARSSSAVGSHPIEEAWTQRLHQRTLRMVTRELLPEAEEDENAQDADGVDQATPMLESRSGRAGGGPQMSANPLLPIGILSIRDVQTCLDAVSSHTQQTHNTASVSQRGAAQPPLFSSTPEKTRWPSGRQWDHMTGEEEIGEGEEDMPVRSRDFDTPAGKADKATAPRAMRSSVSEAAWRCGWPPLQPALVRGEVTAACAQAVRQLRCELDARTPRYASPPAGAASPHGQRATSLPSARPRTLADPTRAATAPTGRAGTVVSVVFTYDHLIATTTHGVFVFFHVSALPLPGTPQAWRNQLLMHTRWHSPASSSATSSTRFHVVTDARPGAFFYCVSPLSIVRLSMLHSLPEVGVPALRQHVVQLLDTASCVATVPPPPPSVAAQTREASVAAAANEHAKEPPTVKSASQTRAMAKKRLDLLSSLAGDGEDTPNRLQSEPRQLRRSLAAALSHLNDAYSADDARSLDCAGVAVTGTRPHTTLSSSTRPVPSTSPVKEEVTQPASAALHALCCHNPLLSVLREHVAASTSSAPGCVRYALTVPFMGTTGGALVVRVGEAESAVDAVMRRSQQPAGISRSQALAMHTCLPPTDVAVRYFLSPLASSSHVPSRSRDGRDGRDQSSSEAWSYLYYACAPDFLYEMALQLALTASTTTIHRQHQCALGEQSDDCLKMSLALSGEARHAYGLFLWKSGRLLEAAVQLGHPGPVPLETLLCCFSRAAARDGDVGRSGRRHEAEGGRRATAREDALLSTSEFIHSVNNSNAASAKCAAGPSPLMSSSSSSFSSAPSSSAVLPFILLLRLRLAAYEGSRKGIPAHHIKVTTLASLLVSLLLAHAGRVESATRAGVLTQRLNDAHPLYPKCAPTSVRTDTSTGARFAPMSSASSTSSRATFVVWKYHLDDPDALLCDAILRYRAELPWSAVARAVRRIASSQRAVWLAGALGRPLEACEGLLARQQHVLEGLLCLEHLTKTSTGGGEGLTLGGPGGAADGHDQSGALALMLPFSIGPAHASVNHDSGETMRKPDAPDPREAQDCSHLAWFQALGVTVAEHVVSAARPASHQRETTPASSASAALQAASSVLYASSLVDHSFPLLPHKEGPDGDVRTVATTNVMTVLDAAAAATQQVAHIQAHGGGRSAGTLPDALCGRAEAVAVVAPLSASRPAPEVAGVRRFSLRTRATNAANVAAGEATASAACLSPAALTALWARFAGQFMHYYPYRVLIRGLCGTLAHSGLAFAAERLVPSLLLYTPAQNECLLAAGLLPATNTDGSQAAPADWTIAAVEERPLTAEGVASLLALVWGSRTLQRAWQRRAGIALTQQWLGQAVSYASLESSMVGRSGFREGGVTGVIATSPRARIGSSPSTTDVRSEAVDSDIHLPDDNGEDETVDGVNDSVELSGYGEVLGRSPARALHSDTCVLSPSGDRELETARTSPNAAAAAGADKASDKAADECSAEAEESADAMFASYTTDSDRVNQKNAQLALLRQVQERLRASRHRTHPLIDDDSSATVQSVTGHVALKFLLSLARDVHLTRQLWADPLASRVASTVDRTDPRTQDLQEGDDQGSVAFALTDGDAHPTRTSALPRPPLSLWLSAAYLIARDMKDEASVDTFMALVASRCEPAHMSDRRGEGGDHRAHPHGRADTESRRWWMSTVLPCFFRIFAHHKRRRGCVWVYHLLGHHEDALRLLLCEARRETESATTAENEAGETPLPSSLSLLVRFIQRAGDAAEQLAEHAAREAKAEKQTDAYSGFTPCPARTRAHGAAAPTSAVHPKEVARHARRELWLFTLRHILTRADASATASPHQETALALRLMSHSHQDIDVTDVLPYIDASAPMATFKDSLYQSLATVSTALHRSKRRFAAAMSDLAVLLRENEVVTDRPVRIGDNDKCFLCEQPALARPFAVFRHCSHTCHITCYRQARQRLQQRSLSTRHDTTTVHGRALTASAATSASVMPTSASFASPTSTVGGGAYAFGTLNTAQGRDTLPTPQRFRLDALDDERMVSMEDEHGAEEPSTEDVECLWCSRSYFDALLTAPLAVPLFTNDDEALPTSVLNLL